MGTQYKSLLGLTEVIADSAEISNIDLAATNITDLTTSRITEGTNLYYTDTRVNNNPNVSSNTTHRERKDNPHGVTAAQVGIDNTDDIIEGVTNLYYTDIRFDDRLATKTTTSLAEGSNLYYTDARFDTRFGIKTTTNLTEGTNLYYTDARFDTRFGIKTTTNLTEGTNLYYTDARFDTRFGTKTTTNLTEGTNLYYTTTRANADFDTRLATKTTTDLAEGTNLYYTDVRFDNRLLSKTTTDLTEGTNLYYTDARFDTRLATKTTDNLTEASNLYYTDARFDTRLSIKTTTDLTEGANLYYTDTRFDTRLATKTTDNLAEGKNNLYYTETRVSANTDVKANSDYRAVGHLPLAGGRMTGNLSMGNFTLDDVDRIFIDKYGTGNNKIVLWDNGYVTQTHFYGFGIQAGILVYNAGSAGSHVFYRNGNIELLRINEDGIFSSRDIEIKGNITISGTFDGVDVATLNTNTTNHIANTNNPHGVLATQITDFDTEVSVNTDVKANSDYRNTGHLPLAGGTLTGDLTFEIPPVIEIPNLTSNTGNADYIASASSEHVSPLPAWKVFDNYEGTDSNNAWATSTTSYSGTGFTYGSTTYGTLVNGALIYGEWVQVRTTSIYAINQLYLQARYTDSAQAPKDFMVAVSSDGTNFTSVYSTTGQTWVNNEKKTFTGIPQTTGTYFRLITTRTQNSGYCGIKEWRLTFDITDNTHSINRVLNLNGTNVDTLIADVKANSDYTAVGHLPLDGGTLTGDLTVDGEMNIGGEKIAIGATNGLQLYGPSSNIGGPHIQAFVSTDDYPVFQQLNNSHGSIAMCFDAYADGFTWKSSSSNSNAIIYKSNTDLEFSYDSGVVAGGEVIWNAGFSMDLANGLVSFSNGLDVTGDLTISGTVDGVDLEALETDVKANTAYRNTGHLPLAGGTLTGNLNMGNQNIINSNALTIGASARKINITGGIEITGVGNTVDGANITCFTTTDNYPIFQNLNYAHNTAYLTFDGYYDYVLWKKSHSTATFQISKEYNQLNFNVWNTGDAGSSIQGIQSSHAMTIDANKWVKIYNGLDVKGNLTISGTVDGVDLKSLETAVSSNTAKVSASGSISTHSDVNPTLLKDYDVLTYFSGEWKNMPSQAPDTSAFLVVNGTRAMTGNLNMGNNSIDNINQVFIDRKSTAYNKLVLWDDGSGSTTEFYGFGIQSATLLYNVNISTANHKFYYGGTNEVFRIGNSGVYSYRNLDVQGNITVSGTVDGVDLAALKSAVDTNSTKVSASGSINTHSDVNITTPVNGHVLTYTGSEWKNIAPAAADGYLPLSGGTMTGNLNMGNQDIDNVNQIFIDRKSAANNKIVLYDRGTPSTTSFYGFGIQSATLLYNVDGSSANHKFYYGGTNELFRIGNAAVYSYRDLDVKGNITVSGTVDGIDIQALNTTVGGKLALTGRTVTGDLTVNGEINVGGAKIARGTTNGLQLYGTLQNLAGPHIQAFVSSDTYPMFQQLNWSHNGIYMCFDAYYDGAWRSSSTNSNAMISKSSTDLAFQYDSGIGLGSGISWNAGISMSTLNGATTIRNSGGGTVIHRGRPKYPSEGQTSWRSSASGEGCIGYNGNLLAWNISDQTGEHGAYFSYLPKNQGNWVSSSDRRLKNNIVDMDINGCCLKISQLKPRNYYMNGDESKTPCSGFLADEMKAVYPELVSNSGLSIGDVENIEGINYTGMIPVLVGAIQSMMGKMNELKAEVELLKVS